MTTDTSTGVREINADEITNTVAELCQKATHFLPDDVVAGLERGAIPKSSGGAWHPNQGSGRPLRARSSTACPRRAPRAMRMPIRRRRWTTPKEIML